MNTDNQFLGTERIGTLMRRYAVPCIISLLVGALYNIVDQLFIANADYLGSFGNAANTVVFPLTVVALAVAVMVGDGCCAYVSIHLGRGEPDAAKRGVANAVVLCLAASVVLTAVYLIFADAIIALFGGTVNDETFRYAQEYFFYITLGVPFYMFGQAMNPIIRADGAPKFAMVCTLLGAVFNIVLDPIFIFTCRWGMMGAAVATVIGQVATAALSVWYLLHMRIIRPRRGDWALRRAVCGRILTLGGTSFLSQISLVAAMAAINNMLRKYGALDAVFSQAQYAQIPMAVVGIVMKFFQIVISIVVGMAAGCIPIVGYNMGAEQPRRVRDLFTRLLVCEALVGVAALVLAECFPRQPIESACRIVQCCLKNPPAEKSSAGGSFLNSRYARSSRGIGDGFCHSRTDARVEGFRDDVLRRKLLVGDEVRQRVCRRDLHFFGNIARAHVERAPEDAGEGEDVVDLVRVVAAPGRNDRCAARLCVLGENFGRRVRAREQNRVAVHRPDHLGRDRARGGYADEHIRANEHIGKAARPALQIRDLRHLFLDPVEPLAPGVDRAVPIAHGDVAVASRQQQLHDGDRRRARAGGHDAYILFFLAHDLQRVVKSRERNNGGAVLVVVEDGNVTFFLQLALNLKAARGGNIFEIDAAERAGDERHGVYKFVHIVRFDAERERVHTAERLEEHAFALHDGHTRLRADVAETQDSRAVGDDGAEIPAPGEIVAFGDVFLNFQARLRDAGRVGEAEIILAGDGHARLYLDFAAPLFVEFERLLSVVL